MTGIFISKKTKAKIRARRNKNPELYKSKKKSGTSKTNDAVTSKPKLSDVSNNSSAPEKLTKDDYRIMIPSGLAGKELKKFRKDARRSFRARHKDADEALLQFADDEGVPIALPNSSAPTDERGTKKDEGNRSHATTTSDDTPNPTKKRKRAKVFPRINDCLLEAEEALRAEKKRAKTDSIENSVSPSEKARYVALDCEMVGIGAEGRRSALARVSITDWDGEILLDTFVRVPEKVTDFRTFVSGVRAKDIRISGDAMELHACRQKVAGILKGKVLVGHALKNDFAALMLNHPKLDVRDTAKYKPFMRMSGRGGGKLRPRKLRDLAKEYLDLAIQQEGEEHSSVDDAKATMSLYKHVRLKWEKEVEAVAAEKLRRSNKRKK